MKCMGFGDAQFSSAACAVCFLFSGMYHSIITNLRCYFFLSNNWAMQFLLSRLTDAHNLGGFAVRNFLILLFSQSDHYIRVSAFKKASREGVAPFSIRSGREPIRSWHAIARWYWTGHSFLSTLQSHFTFLAWLPP